MKRILFLLLFPLFGLSQNQYVAFSKKSEVGNFGTIIKINDNVPQTIFDFNDNGQFPYDYFVEINQTIYGVTEDNGGLNGGTFYKYDLINNNFEILIHFEPIGPNSYFNNLCAGNGKIYGIRTDFFSGTTLIEFDITTQSTTTLTSLAVGEIKDLEFINGKIYGVTDVSTGSNILFSYDLNTNIVTTEFTFNNTDGNFCHSILAHSNGNIYGATTYGGTNSEGVVFEFNTTTNTYNKLYDLTSSEKADNLTEGSNNDLYGYVNPITGGGGRIYKFDLSNNSFTNLHYFSSSYTLNGNEAWFRDFYPPVFNNGYLYGVSGTTNTQNALLFKYDISNNFLDEFSIKRPSSPLMLASNGEFLYQSKFETTNGGLLKYDNTTNIITRIDEAEFGNNGLKPYKMIKASSGLIYGITSGEDSNIIPTGVRLFSYNPNTEEYNVLVNCEEENYGTLPTDIIETTSGKIYFYNSYQTSSGGKLIEYNPVTNTHSLAYDFGSLWTSSPSVENIRFFEKDNILYGIVGYVGNETNTTGIIFSYNTLTNTFNILHQSIDMAKTRWTYLSSNNIMYGVTFLPGVNTGDFPTYKDLFSYNLITNNFTILETNIGGTISGNRNLFVETESNEIFGYFTNTSSSNGEIFKIDTNTNAYSVFYDFGNTTGGTIPFNPFGIKAVNNNIYVASQRASSTTYARNYLLEFDSLDASSYNTILEVTTTNNNISEIIKSEMYVTNDDKLLCSTDVFAFSFTQGDTSAQPIFNFDSNIETAFNFIDLNDPQLSINDFSLETNISIYPNPTTTYININSETNLNNVTLYTINGQKIKTDILDNKIDVRHLTNGLYFLNIITEDNQTKTFKIIKQ
ncbi:T9SS type A sorting domain-containing protein [Olleya aquimaris]|uniref:Putative secreted protein (Por secretion system target) n=1 Tax=Olleya aquimaris TaxID=639310 RepID=A0A327RKT8_9FLAO|nr:T9SS type A sorting domain-containing protein [Olleya aquimaris]RAJ17776.1 putative secreted protein (Por secretion system target) [Olleya aquimaris]